MDGSGPFERSPGAEAPQETLPKPLLVEAPRVQGPQWPDDVRHAMPATGSSRRDTGMGEDRVNVHDVESVHIPVEPGRERVRILEALAPLTLEEENGHSLVGSRCAQATRLVDLAHRHPS